MAFDPPPGTWWPGWDCDGTDITFPLDTLPDITAYEADAITGDIRKVFMSLCEAMYQQYTGTAIEDRPTKVVVERAENISGNIMNVAYSITFQTQILSMGVADE